MDSDFDASALATLEEALDHLRKGDTLVVWRLDRLGRFRQRGRAKTHLQHPATAAAIHPGRMNGWLRERATAPTRWFALCCPPRG